MKLIKDLELGFADAENYKRKENKDLLNRIFIRDYHLDDLCEPRVSFLIGEKGTGKTAYSIYLSNSDYKNTSAFTRYVRETEYDKFITLRREKHLTLSDFSSVWKVIIYLLMASQVKESEGLVSKILNFPKFYAIDQAIDDYYMSAFSPEIIQAFSFVEDSSLAAETIFKFLSIKGEEKTSRTFSEKRFQVNLFYIQKQFENAFSQIKLQKNHILFIDGIDIRPSSIPYDEYLDCIKGLATAVWELNNDFFSSIKGSKGRMRAVLLIRPDIFQSIGLQNQNTKIRDNSVFLDWRTEYVNHRTSQIFNVIDHYISVQQSGEISGGDAWDNYFPWDSNNIQMISEKPTSFISFLRWSYYRPRDIITMVDILKRSVASDPNKEFFTIQDFDSPNFRREYSNYLLGEVKDHLSFYYGAEHYEIFLKFFEFLSGKNKFNYEEYSDAFLKLKAFMVTTSVTTPKFMSTANDFLQFLFDLNVICYIERTERNENFIYWCFRERGYANISPKVKVGVEYQVFYGLARALNVGREFLPRRL